MKNASYYFNDDGIIIPGIIVKGIFSRTFIPRCACCGWSKQRITKQNKHLLIKK